MFNLEDKVTLTTFLGAKKAKGKVSKDENYWLLIGKTGVIVDIENGKALIKFDCDVKSLGLQCHNPIENSLWISFGDLYFQPTVMEVKDGVT